MHSLSSGSLQLWKINFLLVRVEDSFLVLAPGCSEDSLKAFRVSWQVEAAFLFCGGRGGA